MSNLGRVTKVKVLFLALVFVFNFDLYNISAAILEEGLLLSLYSNYLAFYESCSKGIFHIGLFRQHVSENFIDSRGTLKMFCS